MATPEENRSKTNPEASSREASTRKSIWRRWNLFRLTLTRIDELEQFDSEEQKQQALAELATEAGSPLTLGYWIAIIILGASVMGSLMLSKWALRKLGAGPILEDVIKFALTFVVFVVVLRLLHRWGARQDLRKKLLTLGIPVCMRCGYSLRGLTVDHMRCPECGREFDERVETILQQMKPNGQKNAPQ